MKTSHKHLLALAVSTIYLVIIFLLTGACFSINDDRFMGELLSGSITGSPESHLVYIHYLLSLPLSLLYRVSTSIPWFGLMLLFFHLLSCYCILDSFYCKAKNVKDIIVSSVSAGILFLSELYLVAQISYTITAAFMAVAGFVCLILNNNQKMRYLYFVILELCAFLLRDKAMFMILPMGFAVFFGIVIIQKNVTVKNKILETLKVLGLLLAIFVISILGNTIAYHGDAWKTYEKYNDARTTLFDYSLFPPYEEVAHILEKYDVTEIDYNAYAKYTILDYKLSLDCINELAEYMKSNEQPVTLSDISEAYKIKTIWDPYWKVNFLVLAAWFCSVFFLLISKNFRGLIPLIFLMPVRTVIWVYLILAGRFPYRVSMPLFACELVLLVTIVVYFYYTQSTSARLQNISLIIIGLILGTMGLWSFKLQYSDLKQSNDAHKLYMQSFKEIMAYCNNRPDNVYILDTLSFSNYNAEALDGSIYGKRNCVMSSTWFSNSPSMMERHQSYLGNSDDGFYFIMYAGETGTDDELNHPIVLYLAKESESKPQISDRLTTTGGMIFSVIYFDGDLNLNLNP